MLVEVRFAYNNEGLEVLLQVDDERGLVRAKSPTDGVAEFWLDRGREYWGWMEEGQRNALSLLGILTWRVCHGHFYRILQQPDGSLVQDDQFEQEYERLLAEHGPAEYEVTLRDPRRG
jgi:hypothetical protein